MQYGSLVYMFGLKTRLDLNKRAGRICTKKPRNGRFGVELMIDTRERFSVKAENLRLLGYHNVSLVGLPEGDRLAAELYWTTPIAYYDKVTDDFLIR